MEIRNPDIFHRLIPLKRIFTEKILRKNRSFFFNRMSFTLKVIYIDPRNLFLLRWDHV